MAKGKVGIPRPTANGSNLAATVSKLLEVIETGEGQRGDALDAKVTWRDLQQSDLVAFNGAINPNKPLASQVIPPDPLGATPTKPTNFIASPAYTSVVLEWSPANYEGHKFTEVWRSVTNNLGDAILVGQAPYSVYADVVGNNKSFYYWIRFVGTGTDNTGPYSDVQFAQTGLDVDSLLTDLTGQITTSQLALALNQRLDLMDDVNNPSSVIAQVMNEASTRETETTALAQNLATLLGVSDDNIAQIEQLTQVKADQDTVNAIYELKTDVNGHVSGFGTINDGEQSQFFINADTFAILPQSGIFAAQNISTDEIETFSYNGVPHRLRQWKPLETYLPQGASQTVTGIDLAGDVIAPLSLSGSQTLYRCVDGGETAGVEPTWGASIVYDGTVQWERVNTHKGPILPFVVKDNRVIINNAFINELTSENIAAGAITADKLSVVDLSAVSSNMGDITAGYMHSGDNRFIVDLNNGRMLIYDENSNLRVQIGKLV